MLVYQRVSDIFENMFSITYHLQYHHHYSPFLRENPLLLDVSSSSKSLALPCDHSCLPSPFAHVFNVSSKLRSLQVFTPSWCVVGQPWLSHLCTWKIVSKGPSEKHPHPPPNQQKQRLFRNWNRHQHMPTPESYEFSKQRKRLSTILATKGFFSIWGRPWGIQPAQSFILRPNQPLASAQKVLTSSRPREHSALSGDSRSTWEGFITQQGVVVFSPTSEVGCDFLEKIETQKHQSPTWGWIFFSSLPSLKECRDVVDDGFHHMACSAIGSWDAKLSDPDTATPESLRSINTSSWQLQTKTANWW